MPPADNLAAWPDYEPDTLANLVEEHRAIVGAVEKRDAEAAKALIIAHIDNQKTGISRMLAGKEA